MIIPNLKHSAVSDTNLRDLFEEKDKLDEEFKNANLVDKIKLSKKILDINYKISKRKVDVLH